MTPLTREQCLYRDLVLRMLFDQLKVTDIGLALTLRYLGFDSSWLAAISNTTEAELAEAQKIAKKTFLFDILNETIELSEAELPFVPFMPQVTLVDWLAKWEREHSERNNLSNGVHPRNGG